MTLLADISAAGHHVAEHSKRFQRIHVVLVLVVGVVKSSLVTTSVAWVLAS